MDLWSLQVAIKTKLDAQASLVALLNDGVDSIRDDVRTDDAFPYISIHDVSTKSMDTQTVVGTESLVSIHIYSRYSGNKELKEIMDEVYVALNRQPLTLATGTHISTLYTNSNNFTESDGFTRHGQINFSIVTE